MVISASRFLLIHSWNHTVRRAVFLSSLIIPVGFTVINFILKIAMCFVLQIVPSLVVGSSFELDLVFFLNMFEALTYFKVSLQCSRLIPFSLTQPWDQPLLQGILA